MVLLIRGGLCGFSGVFLHHLLDKFGALGQAEAEVGEQEGDIGVGLGHGAQAQRVLARMLCVFKGTPAIRGSLTCCVPRAQGRGGEAADASAGKGLREARGSGKGAGMARNANPYDFANDAGHVMDVATADKLAEHPELLSVPLDNIARWIASGKHTSVSVQRLEQWRAWILEAQQDGAAFRRLLDLLRDDSEEARHWKSWSPFAGVLEAGERREILSQCMPVS